MELKLHPDLREPLRKLCSDPKTTIVVLSGSERSVLDNVFHLAPFLFISLRSLWPFKYQFHIFIYFSRTLRSWICGWQQRMGCFYALQREIGWQQCRSIWIWNGLTVWRWVKLVLFMSNFVLSSANLICLCPAFSMFLSISQKERQGHILNTVKHPLYGITNTQVPTLLILGLLLNWSFKPLQLVLVFSYYLFK